MTLEMPGRWSIACSGMTGSTRWPTTIYPRFLESTKLAGLEVGFPLLDDRLVDFSLRLDPELKLKGLTLRWFFKEALKDFLPPEIITKKKHGFGLPFGVWAVEHAGLRALAVDSLDLLRDSRIVRADFSEQADQGISAAASGLLWRTCLDTDDAVPVAGAARYLSPDPSVPCFYIMIIVVIRYFQ